GVPASEVQGLIDKEIEGIEREGISTEELQKVKNQFRLSRFTCVSTVECTSLQSPLGRALDLAEFTLFDNDPALINTEVDRYLAVTADQLKAAALKSFDPQNAAVMYIKPTNPEKSA